MVGLERKHFSNKTRGSLLFTRISMRTFSGAFPHKLRVRRASCGPTSAQSLHGARCAPGKTAQGAGVRLGKGRHPRLSWAECPMPGRCWVGLRHTPAITLQASYYDAGGIVLGFLSRSGAYSGFSVCQCEGLRC